MMETIAGYVLLASDMQAARSIVAMKKDEDKMKVLGTHQVLAYNGEPGQCRSLSLSLCLLVDPWSGPKGDDDAPVWSICPSMPELTCGTME